MATVNIKYGASVAVTCTVNSLASSATAGRESTVVDNSVNLYDDALLSATFEVNTTTGPTTGTSISLFVYGILNDTPTYPAPLTGSDAQTSLASAGQGNGFLKLAGATNVDVATTSAKYAVGPVSLASLFGGIMPEKWGCYVLQNTGQTLAASNNAIYYTPVTYTVV